MDLLFQRQFVNFEGMSFQLVVVDSGFGINVEKYLFSLSNVVIVDIVSRILSAKETVGLGGLPAAYAQSFYVVRCIPIHNSCNKERCAYCSGVLISACSRILNVEKRPRPLVLLVVSILLIIE